ncbi:MAG: hypothetical protein ACYC6G_11790 [Desulfobaccales bacterium]
MEKYFPLIIGFIGAIIGAATSITTMYLQNKTQIKREKIKLAAELGLEDFKLSFELVKTSGKPFTLFPLACFVHFHSELLELLETGELNETKIKEIFESNQKVIKAIKEVNKEIEEGHAV